MHLIGPTELRTDLRNMPNASPGGPAKAEKEGTIERKRKRREKERERKRQKRGRENGEESERKRGREGRQREV